MTEPFIAEVRIFAGNFAPRGWAFCDGQLLPVGQNEALFMILGTLYGGDGKSTFALPDMRGRRPVHSDPEIGLRPGDVVAQKVREVKGNSRNQEDRLREDLVVTFIIALQGTFPSPPQGEQGP